MNWKAIRAGFEDEILKIAEMSLAGLSSETLMNYPQPQAMPSAAYEKAQAILQKVRSPLPDAGVEKTSKIRPDLMEPGPDAMLSKKKGEPGATAQAKSFGAHVLGGAGAAKFMHDWVDSGRQAYGKAHVPSPKAKFLAMSGGAALGLGEYGRKRFIKAHRAKHHQGGATT